LNQGSKPSVPTSDETPSSASEYWVVIGNNG